MKTFNEYIEDQNDTELDEELLLEDPVTIIAGILAIPTLLVLAAWGSSIVAAGYYKFLSSMTNRTVNVWRKVVNDTKNKVNKNRVISNVKEMAYNPKAREQGRVMKENKRKFSEELAKVYSAIEAKDFNTAKVEFGKVDKDIRHNPDVYKVIIFEITKALKEPPLYVSSPGNKTYQAIKKIINIRVARASAMATKMAIEKSLRNDDIRSMEDEDDTTSKEEEPTLDK